MSDYIIVDGELKHYGVPGMKWGVRRKRGSHDPRQKRKSKVAYDAAKLAYDRNKKLTNDFFKSITTGSIRQRQKAYRDDPTRLERFESRKELQNKTIAYLNTLDRKKVKELVEYDVEHGKHFVEARLFDKSASYYSYPIYIEDDPD